MKSLYGLERTMAFKVQFRCGRSEPVLVAVAAAFWFFSCFIPSPVYAGRQVARFDYLSMQDGLSQDHVLNILQDRKGFIWFATSNGLSRYDGHVFKVYRSDENDSNSLSDSFVAWIIEDRQGCLWIGTNRGLNRFDPETERFTRYLNTPNDPDSLSHNVIRAVCEDRDGFIWVGTVGGGVNRLDPATGRFTRYLKDPNDPNSLSDNSVWGICQDRAGAIWIAANVGLNRLDPKTGRITRYLHDPNDMNSLSSDRTYKVAADSSGSVWVGTEGDGLNRLDPETGRVIRYRHDPADPDSLSNDTVKYIHVGGEGRVWLATFGGGFDRFDPATGRFTHFQHDPADPDSLASDEAWTVYEDRAGLVWVGLFHLGVNKFDPNGTGFMTYRHREDDPTSLSANFVSSIAEDAGGFLWVGTIGGGLNRLDRGTGQFKRYPKAPGDPLSMNSDLVRVVCIGPSGAIWIGTEDRGLNRLDPDTGQFTRYMHDSADPGSLGFDKVFAVLEDRKGRVWVGTFGGGLDRFDPKVNLFTHFRFNPADPGSLSSDTVWALHEDAEGNLWVGTQGGGLCRFDEKTGRFIRYQHNPEDPSSLSHNNIHSIYEDSSGALWVSTINKLNRFDRGKGAFTRYGEAQGLASDAACSVLEDDKGVLWVATYGGLSRFNTLTNEIRNFDARDLLYGHEFYVGARCKTRDGMLFFGRPYGLTGFYPQKIQTNLQAPAPTITELSLANRPVSPGEIVNGRRILDKAIAYTREIKLGPKDSIVSFEFSALHFAAPEKNQYAYRMEGAEKDWNYSGNRHFVTYTYLPPGQYVFRVKAANNHGVWDEKGTSLKITVFPPFWQTWWFRTFLVVIMLSGFFAWHLNRTRLIRKRSRELEETVTERTRALRAAQEKLIEEERMAALGRLTATVSHEIRNPLGVIRSSVYYLQTKLKGADDANARHLARIDAQVSQCDSIVGELLEYTAGRVVAPFPNDFAAFIGEVAADTAALKDVRVIFDLAPDLPPIPFDREKMRRVAVNLFQNSAQALRDKKDMLPEEKAAAYDPWIKVRAYIREDRFIFEVEDNGPGMDAATLVKAFEPLFTLRAQGTGLGLSIARKIVEEHHGTLTLESRPGGGTKAVVSMPMATSPHEAVPAE